MKRPPMLTASMVRSLQTLARANGEHPDVWGGRDHRVKCIPYQSGEALVKLGYATRSRSLRLGAPKFWITDAGRARIDAVSPARFPLTGIVGTPEGATVFLHELYATYRRCGSTWERVTYGNPDDLWRWHKRLGGTQR